MAPTNNGNAKGKGRGKAKAKKGPASTKKPSKKAAAAERSQSKTQSKAKDDKQKFHFSWRRQVLADEQEPKQIATVPYTLEGNSKGTKQWPSALFLDAQYTSEHGILIADDNRDNYFRETEVYTNSEKPDGMIRRSLPCLTETEAALWCHKHAAHTAAKRRFPVEVARLLGTITLEIQETPGKTITPPRSKKPLEVEPRRADHNTYLRWPVKQLTKKQAHAEAQTEALQTKNESQRRKHDLHSRASEIFQQWSAVQSCPAKPEQWHPKTGALPVGDRDEHYVHLHDLKTWLDKGLKAGSLKDLQENDTADLYNGLTKVPISATDVLSALVDLSKPAPCGYEVPLLNAYPRIMYDKSSAPKSKTKQFKTWKIQIGVYMHRLLPEILTIRTLHTVISALDEGSYTISEPLSLPPMGPEVFASAPFPKVDTSAMEDRDEGRADGKNDEPDVIDVDLEVSGDRDELLLSPFSTKGLLKLLENKGCDVSSWPQLEQQLHGKFKLDLLLHQQHAICWMVQMENLEGAYGINSLLWEQRTFPDGGHYYYSPALGQIRLGAPPPVMKGGLLCDEQGLGKTVEILGLIMATLAEMKQYVKTHFDSKKKKPCYNYDGENYYDVDSSEDEDEYISHTTLIIVPPALVAQWLHEIEKAVGKDTLTVSLLLSATGDLQTCLPPPSEKCTNAITDPKEDTDETLWEKIQKSDIVLTTYDSLDNKRACSKTLQNVQWGRVVLDEMQEIRSSTTQIAKNCEKLQCNKRWMLSGTPLFQGVEDLRGELNFLRLEPFGAALEDGFFDFAIQKPWDQKDPHAIATLQTLGLVALRRSKDMTLVETGGSLLDLKPMVVEYIPVSQSHSERALYCWMEYIVACEIQDRKNGTKAANAAIERADAKSRGMCLRLLRELAITPVLLNGGLGCPSQLDAINQLMIRHNRREQLNQTATAVNSNGDDDANRKRHEGVRVMSCDQALRFLTQHQQSARTDQDFVTDVAFGGGRGVTNRERAGESAEKRYDDARKEVADAEKALSEAKKKRATALWHSALELITTGRYNDGRLHKFTGLWRWRRIVCEAVEKQKQSKATRRNSKRKLPPALLTRGWRPSHSFCRGDIFQSHPEFSWAHPHALLAQNIPKEVNQKELAIAMRDAAKLVPPAKKEREKYTARLSKFQESLKDDTKSKNKAKIQDLEEKLQGIEDRMDEKKKHDAKLKLPTIVKVAERKHVKGFWKAIVQFESQKEVSLVMSAASRASGAGLNCRQSIPHINAMIVVAKENLEQAESERQVHPSEANKKLLGKARKELDDISEGLRLIAANNAVGSASLPTPAAVLLRESSISSPHVLLSKAMGPCRNVTPRSMAVLVDSAELLVEEMTTEILKQQQKIARNNRIIEQLEKVVTGEVSEEVNQLSAFATLEALSHGEVEKTQCPICLGHLGCDADDGVADHPNSASRGSARKKAAKKKKVEVTMINCGHFFCTPCLNHYVHERISGSNAVNCPNCRQVFNLSRDTIQVDHTLTDEQEQRERERVAAKQAIREAGKMLEHSKGQLSADLWRALYLAFDVPQDFPNRGHALLTAIPRDVLAHLRAATGMEVHQKRSDVPVSGSAKGAGICSKIEALLRDLPSHERSVIFSSNKDCLMHIRSVLNREAIGCQSIYTGQSTEDLKDAVSNWKTVGESPTDPPPFPCLLVQAGAAAAGLTLTAASKMFIMEPFLRQEEEHQAYARLHRYSQKKKVSVKVYYTPVSVESRLLEWRKGARKASVGKLNTDGEFESNFEQDTRVIYHDVDEESDDDQDNSSVSCSSYKDEFEDNEDSEDCDEKAQANYLLGLIDNKCAKK